MVISTTAMFTPEVEDRALESETQKVKESFAEAEQLEPTVDTGAMQRGLDDLDMPSLDADGPGVGGGGITPVPLGGLRSGVGSAGGAAAAVKAAAPVALVGGGLLALKGIHDSLAQVSPRLAQIDSMFAAALENFRAPFGNALAKELQPSAQSLLQASVEFRRAAQEQGFGAAFEGLIGDFAQPRIKELLTTPMGPRNQVRDLFDDIRAGGELGAVFGGIFGGQLGGQIGGALGATMTAAVAPLIQPLRMLTGGVAGLDDTIDDFDADVSGLFADVESNWPGWPNIVDPVSLGRFVTGVALANHVTGVNLASFVSGVNLSNFVGGTHPSREMDRPSSRQATDDPGRSGATVDTGTGNTGSAAGGSGATFTGTAGGISRGGAVMQEGGIVTGPRQGVIGEANPEAVLPLDTFFSDLQRAVSNAMESASPRQDRGDDDRIIRELKRTRKAIEEMQSDIKNVDAGGSRPVSR